MKKLRGRVIYGYSPSDYISIGEDFIEKAKYAWLNDKKFIAPNGKMISGKEIKRIEPDVRFYTGWNDNYEFGSSDDTKQINRDVPIKEIEDRTLLADKRVRFVMEKKNPALLNNPEQLLLE
jgi:hypothetical protein